MLGLINQLNDELALQKANLSDLTDTVTDLQESTQTQIDSLSSEIQTLRNEVESNQDMTDQELAEINYQITVMNSDIQSLNNELINLQSQYNQLLSQVTNLEQTVSSNYVYLEARSWDLSGNNLFYNKGRVGIGTDSPSATLEVKGDIKATTLRNMIWSTSSTGTYDLTSIFRDARNNGLAYGPYDCMLRSNNSGHWTGYRFTAIVNYYANHGSHPHKSYNVNYLDAGAGGCSDRVHSLNPSTRSFGFSRGSCYQNVTLTCSKLD